MTHPSKGIAALIAAQGRNGDDELIHVNKQELAVLERLGDRVGIKTTTNPHTGLKEAFNWGSTIGGVLGGIAGTFVAPGAGTAAGAALGSGLGTKATGGSTEQALMNGAIAGVTAWAGSGLADTLAQAGSEVGKEATGELVKTGIEQGIQDTGAQTLASAAPPVNPMLPVQPAAQIPNTPGVDTFAALTNRAPAVGDLTQMSPAPWAPTATPAGTPPINPMTGEVAKMSMPGSSGQIPMAERAADYWGNVGKGLESLNTPGKIGDFVVANKGNLLGAGLGAYGALTEAPSNPNYSDTTSTGYTGPSYRGEVYYTPYGERRTRAVPYARGGDVYGDYDGVDENADGGYIPGGGLNFAAGGISDLGHYSDGGQLLRGAGDGVSDSIPASIADKRPARLADGEFVVPARAVSELGNGSTEAGAKQLYGMLDRIAKKRKKGNGLAYQANPKKLMPA